MTDKNDIQLPPMAKPQVPIVDADIDLMDIKRLAAWCERTAKEYARQAIAHAETQMNRAGRSDSEIDLPPLPDPEIDDAGAFMSDAQVMSIDSAKEYARVAVEHDRKRRVATKPSTDQDWAALDPAIAFHLIERHAENWDDAGAMMQAYADAHIEADRQRKGEVVVTKDEAGNIVAVTRQDDEGRILSVIAEADRQRRGEPVGEIRPDDQSDDEVWAEIWAELPPGTKLYAEPVQKAQKECSKDAERSEPVRVPVNIDDEAQYLWDDAIRCDFKGFKSRLDALLACYGHPVEPDGWKLVPVEPDTALLVSMATCLYHGFGLLDEGRQDSMLHDMRKLHEEVLGKGYYNPENRERYLSMLEAAPKFGEEE